VRVIKGGALTYSFTLITSAHRIINLKTRIMKRFKVTYNYFDGGKKRIAIRILEALDRDHAIMIMAMWPKLILKVEQYEKI
jgi:hypothetical protein